MLPLFFFLNFVIDLRLISRPPSAGDKKEGEGVAAIDLTDGLDEIIFPPRACMQEMRQCQQGLGGEGGRLGGTSGCDSA